MRPDNLAVYVFLNEVVRLAAIKPWRRFKPAIVCTAHVMVTRLPAKKPVQASVKQLVDIYRQHIDADDVREVIKDLGLEHGEALVATLEPWLGDIFDSCLEWHEDASVTARFGDTEAQTLCSELPFDEYGRLQGVVSYVDETYRFHRGLRVPEKITIELIDSVEDELDYHAALVDLFGITEYLLASKSTVITKGDKVTMYSTDRYAQLLVDGKMIWCPLRLDMDAVQAWLRAKNTVLSETDVR